ncbi:hypothetical protein NDU88_000222, partial [Pleurodeles waltl]
AFEFYGKWVCSADMPTASIHISWNSQTPAIFIPMPAGFGHAQLPVLQRVSHLTVSQRTEAWPCPLPRSCSFWPCPAPSTSACVP